MKALAIGHGAATEEAGAEGDGTSLDGGAGQVFRMFEEMLEDPAYPMPYTSHPRAEAALGPEEVHCMYGFVTTLAHKVTLVPPEHGRTRQAPAGMRYSAFATFSWGWATSWPRHQSSAGG